MTFARPQSLAEAIAELSRPGSMVLGGGTSLTLLLKNRLIEPEHLVWVGGLTELAGVTTEGDGLALGSTTTLREIARSPLVRDLAPVLSTAAGKVGNPRVRAVATLGGALVHGDPRQDLPPVLLALRARAVVASADGEREIGLDELYLGFMETALGEDEILTKVVVPSRAGWRDEYARFTPGSDDDYPTVGVAVSVRRAGDTVEDAEVALGGVDSRAILVPEAAAALRGGAGGAEQIANAASIAAAACNPGTDQRGSAEYKRAMVGVWTRRTLEALLG